MVNELQKITDSIQVQVNPNLSPSQIGGELAAALNGLKVAQISDEDLSGTLRYCMLLTGIREKNLPAGLEIQVLFDFIRDNFGTHTPEEIKLAFKKAIAGTLSVDSNCYENFSCAYFGRIMAAYREWSKNEVKFIAAKIEKELPAPEADFTEVWNDILQAAREGRIEQKIIGAAICDWLVEVGELKLSGEEQEKIFDKAKSEYRFDLVNKVLDGEATSRERQELEDIHNDQILDDTRVRIINRAKVLAVKEYALKSIK